MLNPECCTPVKDVVENRNRDEDMCRRSTLEVLLLSLFVPGRVHCRGQVDHPGKHRLDECVVQQVHGETDATEEVENR